MNNTNNIDTTNVATHSMKRTTEVYNFHLLIKGVYSVLKLFEQRVYTEHSDFAIELKDYLPNIFSDNISKHVTLLKLGKHTDNNATTRFYYVYNITGDKETTTNYCDTVSDIYKFILDMGQE